MSSETEVAVETDLHDAVKHALVETLYTEGAGNVVATMLEKHLGADPNVLPFVSQEYYHYLAVTLQRSLDQFLGEPGRTHRLVGITSPTYGGAAPLRQMLAPPTLNWASPLIGPVDYVNREYAAGKEMACIGSGLFLVEDAGGPFVIWIMPHWRGVQLEVMAPTSARVDAILADIRERASLPENNPYLGQMVMMGVDRAGHPYPTFIPRPQETTEDELILPPELLHKIDQHAVAIAGNREALKASGQHLKRGLLLYGRPGTGKTHTVRYLATKLPEATVILLPGSRMSLVKVLKELIQKVSPAVIVIDDVDLIAEDRSIPSGDRSLLFDLLEVLDGIGEDSDVLFVLTTNRTDVLEPAVAARPGRIDQAIEIPLPDTDCRTRLFQLYSRGLDVTIDDLDSIIGRTNGVTASFIKEMLRRAAVISLQEKGSIAITDTHVHTALDEMLDPENPLTAVLLGAEPNHALPTMEQVMGQLGAGTASACGPGGCG